MKKVLIRLYAIPLFILGIVGLIPYWIFTGKDISDKLINHWERCYESI